MHQSRFTKNLHIEKPHIRYTGKMWECGGYYIARTTGIGQSPIDAFAHWTDIHPMVYDLLKQSSGR